MTFLSTHLSYYWWLYFHSDSYTYSPLRPIQDIHRRTSTQWPGPAPPCGLTYSPSSVVRCGHFHRPWWIRCGGWVSSHPTSATRRKVDDSGRHNNFYGVFASDRARAESVGPAKAYPDNRSLPRSSCPGRSAVSTQAPFTAKARQQHRRSPIPYTFPGCEISTFRRLQLYDLLSESPGLYQTCYMSSPIMGW